MPLFLRRTKPVFIRWWCCSALCAAVAGLSCTGGAALRFNNLRGYFGHDDYSAAIAAIERKGDSWYGSNNRFLYSMDIGALYHYAGRYDSSSRYLQQAAAMYDDLYTRSVTNEAASLLVNDNVRPYRSRPCELVLLHQMNLLNYELAGNNDEALVESRAVQLLFNEWERADQNDRHYADDAAFHYLSSIAYDAAGAYDDAMISLYKAVETIEKGPFPLAPAIKNYAYYMLRLNHRDQDTGVLGISADVPEAQVPGLQNGQTEIILIGYAGRGPRLIEDKWWGTYIRGGLLAVEHYNELGETESFAMPAPFLPDKEYEKAAEGRKNDIGTTFHISFSLPKEETFPSRTSYFTARAGSGAAPVMSVLISDLDKQLEKNLEDARTATMTRTVIRTVLRTIAAQTAKSKMETASPLANLLVNLGTDALADQLEHADTRSCFLIPKTIQIARIPVTPGTYSVQAEAHDPAGGLVGEKTFENIRVLPGQKKFLLYCSFR
jgi:tetratricopeptide (TPR) repeat protein